MIIVWGSRLYGKVDEVPGMFYVATKFAHLWYIPLIPLGTHLILGEDDDGGWEGVKIPFSIKSLFVAWARTGLVIFSLWCLFGIVMSVIDMGIIGGILSGVGLAFGVGLFWLTKRLKGINTADMSRARELGQAAGFDEDGLQLIESHFMALDAISPNPIEPR